MYFYSAYNLRISSDIPLPELPPAPSGGDVEVRLMPEEPQADPRSIQWEDSPFADAVFRFPLAGRFHVRGGREVIITPEPDADLKLLRLYIQGMMLATVLYQRNQFVLHSSTVRLEDRAIAFVGSVGAGKSSLAAAFHAQGRAVVADDNLAVDLETVPPIVTPAFPSLKVYPAIAESLGFDSSTLRPMHPSQIKQAQAVDAGFSNELLPLACIYVLDRDAAPGATRLSVAASLTELIRHSVPTRWGVPGNGPHLLACSQLARVVPMFRIRTFTSLSEISGIVRGIEGHSLTLENVQPSAVTAATR